MLRQLMENKKFNFEKYLRDLSEIEKYSKKKLLILLSIWPFIF